MTTVPQVAATAPNRKLLNPEGIKKGSCEIKVKGTHNFEDIHKMDGRGLAPSALAPLLSVRDAANVSSACGQLVSEVAASFGSTKLPLDQWTQVARAVGCKALQAQLSDVFAACASVSHAQQQASSTLSNETHHAASQQQQQQAWLSPMLDPVITALAQ